MFARAIRICATDAAHLFYLKLHKYRLRFIVALVCMCVCVCVIIFILKSICFGMCMVCLFVVVARSLVCLQQNAQLNLCLINRIQVIQFIYHNDNLFILLLSIFSTFLFRRLSENVIRFISFEKYTITYIILGLGISFFLLLFFFSIARNVTQK